MFAAALKPARQTAHRLFTVVVLSLVAGGLFAGCGSSAAGGGSDLDGPSATEFNDRFAKSTGVRLVDDGRFNNDDWTVFSLPNGTDHYDRFGAFSIYVVSDEEARDGLLRKSDDESGALEPNGSGYAFRRNEGSDSYSVVQRFEENIVLVWQAGESQEVDDSYRRLSAAVEAAATGDESKVPAAQRDCAASGIDPKAGKEGTCRVGDNEVTVVNSGSELRTPAIKARLQSVGDAAQIEPSSSYSEPVRPRGRFLIVTYELTNNGDAPIDDVEPQLNVDGRTYAAARGVDYDLYGNEKRPLPLQPGETATMITAFDVSEQVVDAALEGGAFVLPATADKYGYLSLDNGAAEGRIRLAGAEVDASAGRPGTGSSSSSDDNGSTPDRDYDEPTPSTRPSSSTRTVRRQHRAERAVKQFFTAVRTGKVSSICNRLTLAELANQGGMATCRSKVVRAAFQSKVPSSNRRLQFTTILTRSDTRAMILVKANGYRGMVRLARQQGLWRVQALLRTK